LGLTAAVESDYIDITTRFEMNTLLHKLHNPSLNLLLTPPTIALNNNNNNNNISQTLLLGNIVNHLIKLNNHVYFINSTNCPTLAVIKNQHHHQQHFTQVMCCADESLMNVLSDTTINSSPFSSLWNMNDLSCESIIKSLILDNKNNVDADDAVLVFHSIQPLLQLHGFKRVSQFLTHLSRKYRVLLPVYTTTIRNNTHTNINNMMMSQANLEVLEAKSNLVIVYENEILTILRKAVHGNNVKLVKEYMKLEHSISDGGGVIEFIVPLKEEFHPEKKKKNAAAEQVLVDVVEDEKKKKKTTDNSNKIKKVNLLLEDDDGEYGDDDDDDYEDDDDLDL